MDNAQLIRELIKNLQEEAAWKALDMENNPQHQGVAGDDYDSGHDAGWLDGMKNAVTILEDFTFNENEEQHAA